MQALVDFRGRFMNVNIGWPGTVHDARVFVNSSCYKDANDGKLFPNWTTKMGNVDVPLIILGDPAYPLLPWLMKPYIEHPGSSQKDRTFNYRQSRARMCVENAFGRLKGRWRCLMKRMDYDLENVPNVIAACVTLHNLCEILGDHCREEWFTTDSSLTSRLRGSTFSTAVQTRTTANAIRDAIRDSL